MKETIETNGFRQGRFNTLQKVGAAILLLVALCIASKAAENAGERVMFKGGEVFLLQNGKPVALEKDLEFPKQIKISTNGTFTVNNGKPRAFAEGQILDREGMLTSPDGSVAPVVDHVTVKDGKVVIVRDGESQPLQQETTLANGTKLLPDGTLRTPDGGLKRLIDGQLLTLDGSVLAAKDSVSLQDGKVVVQKDGSLLKINPTQSIMMNDGTKVFGDGKVTKPDGTSIELTEGQIITIEGVVKKN
jgi:hypothetical protein